LLKLLVGAVPDIGAAQFGTFYDLVASEIDPNKSLRPVNLRQAGRHDQHLFASLPSGGVRREVADRPILIVNETCAEMANRAMNSVNRVRGNLFYIAQLWIRFGRSGLFRLGRGAPGAELGHPQNQCRSALWPR